jgi:hypothetical protein
LWEGKKISLFFCEPFHAAVVEGMGLGEEDNCVLAQGLGVK